MGFSVSKIVKSFGQFGADLTSKDQRIAPLKVCLFLCSGFYTTVKIIDFVRKTCPQVKNTIRIPLGIVGSLIAVKLARIRPIATASITLGVASVANSQNRYTPQQFKNCLNTPNYQFPSNPIVEDDLDLTDSPHLTFLPEGLHVKGSLYLRDCTHLASLPEGLHIGGNLGLTGCTQLTSLPQGLQVGGNLRLNGCTSLTSLPQGLQVGGHLNLRNCIGLTSLPQGLQIRGDLGLEGCTGLTSLPQRLQVGGHLNLSDCTNLTSLPQELRMGDDLDLRRCTRLTSLPSWITQLGPRSDRQTRVVYLENTGLSEEMRNSLMQAHAPGMRFYFSQAASVSDKVFGNLEEALEFWKQETQNPTLHLPDISFDLEQLEEVLTFLSRLTTTAEYKNVQSRVVLATRVLEAFTLMATNKEIKDRAVDLVQQGLISCDDRIISTLDEIELMLNIFRLESSGVDETKLRRLGKSYLLLEMVNKKALEHKNTLTWVDEVEIYLAFQTSLADRFSLPLSTRHMIFRRCVQITDEQIQAIGDAIEKEYSEEQLDAFLAIWGPWIKHQRRKAVPAYEILEKIPSDVKEHECCINLAYTSQPVQYEKLVYDYHAFAKWYISKGIDPFNRQPIELSKLKRLA